MFPVKFPFSAVSGISQGHFGGHQAQQLGGIGGFQGCRWNAEFGGIEGHRRKKTATVAIDMVRAFGITIITVVQLTVGFRWLGNTVDAVEQGPPICLHVFRPGKHAAHADDGYRLPNRLCVGCHFLVPLLVVIVVRQLTVS